jgi:hypothetical protein
VVKVAAATKVAIDAAALLANGGAAYALAVANQAVVAPRMPAGTINGLAADLTLLGAAPAAAPAAAAAGGAGAAVTPTLSDALAKALKLLSAAHEAVKRGKPKAGVRKAWGVTEGGKGDDVKRVEAAMEKVVERATAEPGEALGFGILAGDVAVMQGALADLKAAEATHAAGGLTRKEKSAAEGRVRTAIERIAGAGVMAFALDGTGVRASFEALVAKG